MVRRGLSFLALLVAVGCGGDDGRSEGPPTTAIPTPATLPDEVEPGRGFLVLDGESALLTVTDCALESTTDPATGVTTELRVSAEDAFGRLVDVVRSSFTADVPTVTDTVTISDPTGEVLESSRADRDGLQIDLRLDNPVGPLLEVDPDTGTILADGVFGPVGGAPDDPANVDGKLLVRCP